MNTKKYFVTNQSEGSICLTGRQRFDIPGLCKDMPLVLPESSARQTIARLKQRYPLLKFREAESAPAPEKSAPKTRVAPVKEAELALDAAPVASDSGAAQKTDNKKGK